MSEIQTDDQRLIVLLQQEIIDLRAQIALKDKQILRQGVIIKAVQRAVR